MRKDSKLKSPLERISSIFSGKRQEKKEEKIIKSQVMRLNFFLLNAALKKIQKRGAKKPLSLFTTKILSSKSKHLSALVKQAELACSKQDIELFSYKEFFCRNQLALRRAVQWKFSKYIKSRQEALALIHKMKESSPETFKRHLITLLKEENLSADELDKEVKTSEEEWKLWQQGGSSPTSVSPL